MVATLMAIELDTLMLKLPSSEIVNWGKAGMVRGWPL
jgi:hypothetical protein